jgi:phosphoribosylformylglycinamidine synthase
VDLLLAVQNPAARSIIIIPMKAHVYVTLKTSVLDAQGQTVANALNRMHYKGVADVRQGKYFLLTLDGSLNPEHAQTEVDRIAREVLVNPVIEEYTSRIEP